MCYSLSCNISIVLSFIENLHLKQIKNIVKDNNNFKDKTISTLKEMFNNLNNIENRNHKINKSEIINKNNNTKHSINDKSLISNNNIDKSKNYENSIYQDNKFIYNKNDINKNKICLKNNIDKNKTLNNKLDKAVKLRLTLLLTLFILCCLLYILVPILINVKVPSNIFKFNKIKQDGTYKSLNITKKDIVDLQTTINNNT